MANSPDTPVWFEHTSDAPARAETFYAEVAGWTVVPSGDSRHGGYRIASAADGTGVAGLMTPPPGMDGVPGWAIHFAAADVDAAAARVVELGGAVRFGPHDIPGIGRMTTCTDPQGIAFHLMRGNSPQDSRAFRPGEPADGHGVWIELATPDPDAAFAFYGALFGWKKTGTMPMGPMGDYAFIGAGEGAPAPGAIMSSGLTGAPARWSWYVHVLDIDAAITAATDRGGTLVQGPNEVPGGDWSAVLTDDQGHAIGLVGPRA